LLRFLDVAPPRRHTPDGCDRGSKLIAFAFALTRVDSAFAGRAYAAYGGIYIAASLVWLWLIEGQAPTRTDLVGAALAISGALIIIGFAARVR
jgi:small multidrug resistance family-3 protein